MSVGVILQPPRETPQTPRYATVPTNGIIDNRLARIASQQQNPRRSGTFQLKPLRPERESIFPGVAPFKVRKQFHKVATTNMDIRVIKRYLPRMQEPQGKRMIPVMTLSINRCETGKASSPITPSPHSEPFQKRFVSRGSPQRDTNRCSCQFSFSLDSHCARILLESTTHKGHLSPLDMWHNRIPPEIRLLPAPKPCCP
ncbi:MAG: hypothetical protein CM15mP49_33210 [Actinomycetota bacterium]|nr:MAG: hypothetical protein CM15mP49_33210 [Actinomycetota bacterium]